MECIPDREIWRPLIVRRIHRHLPQRAVTLTTIVYWPGDPAIPFWEVTAEVTALITRGAVTGSMLYILVYITLHLQMYTIFGVINWYEVDIELFCT